MNWTLEQLQTLRCVAETGSFSAAARRLGRAQSAVSTAIANLELDRGCELFARGPRTPVLTPAGKAMLHCPINDDSGREPRPRRREERVGGVGRDLLCHQPAFSFRVHPPRWDNRPVCGQ